VKISNSCEEKEGKGGSIENFFLEKMWKGRKKLEERRIQRDGDFLHTRKGKVPLITEKRNLWNIKGRRATGRGIKKERVGGSD